VKYQLKICTEVEPELLPVVANHLGRCWLYQDYKDVHQAPLKNIR